MQNTIYLYMHRCIKKVYEGDNFDKIFEVLRDEPKSLWTQYQVQNNTQVGKNQKIIRNDKIELIVKNYRKNKQPIVQQRKFQPPNCPFCKQNICLEFDKGCYFKNCEYIIKKRKHQIDKKVLRQDRYFSTRLPYANEKIRKNWMNMVITTDNSTEETNNNL